MMNNAQFIKAVRVPTQHVGLYFVDRVPTGGSPQATNRFPTSFPIDLGCSSHMELGGGFKFLHALEFIKNVSPANPELRVALKVFETLFKIILRQRQVSVELHDEIPVIASNCIVSVIKG